MSYTKNRPETYYGELFRNLGNQIPQSFVSGSMVGGGSVSGTYNPAWRSQIRQGGNATTPCSGTWIDVVPGFIDFGATVANISGPPNYVTFGLTGIPVNSAHTFTGPPASLVTDVTNRCIRKFIEQADAARSSFEFGQDAGEIRETIHGIIHPLQSLREFTLSHLSRLTKVAKSVKHKASLSKAIADSFLEYKFGWAPLAADIGQGYADLMNNHHFNLVPIRASAYDTYPIQISDVNSTTISAGVVITSIRVTGSYSVTMKGAIRTGAAGSKIGLMQNLQLDLPHFVPTIWDLLPYSWIADYFLNVGDLLRAVCFRTSDLSWGNKTIRTTNRNDWMYKMVLNNISQFQYVHDRTDYQVNPSISRVDFSRSSISSSDLIPQLQFSLPLGSAKPWENMLALLVGRQSEFSRVASNLR